MLFNPPLWRFVGGEVRLYDGEQWYCGESKEIEVKGIELFMDFVWIARSRGRSVDGDRQWDVQAPSSLTLNLLLYEIPPNPGDLSSFWLQSRVDRHHVILHARWGERLNPQLIHGLDPVLAALQLEKYEVWLKRKSEKK